MDSIRKLRIKHEDGSFSNSIPIGANSDDIFMTTGGTLTEAMTDVENAIISMDKINETQSKSIDGLVEGVSSNMVAIAKQQEVNEKQETKMENFEKALAQEKVYVFDNVYAMKNANNLKAGMYCITKGYYTLNDGGKGEYLIRTKTDNDVDDGGSIHELLNNLVAELIIEDGGVNVKQFGAYGDGEHDDSEKIQNAYLFINRSFSFDFRQVIFTEGFYKITKTIEIPIYIKTLVIGNVFLIADLLNGSLLCFTSGDINKENNNFVAYKTQSYVDGNIISSNSGVLILMKSNNIEDINKSANNTVGILFKADLNGLNISRCNFNNIMICRF